MSNRRGAPPDMTMSGDMVIDSVVRSHENKKDIGALMTEIARLNKRANDHEERIQKLEAYMHKSQAIAGLVTASGLLKWVGAALIAGLGLGGAYLAGKTEAPVAVEAQP